MSRAMADRYGTYFKYQHATTHCETPASPVAPQPPPSPRRRRRRRCRRCRHRCRRRRRRWPAAAAAAAVAAVPYRPFDTLLAAASASAAPAPAPAPSPSTAAPARARRAARRLVVTSHRQLSVRLRNVRREGMVSGHPSAQASGQWVQQRAMGAAVGGGRHVPRAGNKGNYLCVLGQHLPLD